MTNNPSTGNDLTLKALQLESDKLLLELMKHLENPKKAKMIRKRLAFIIYKIHSLNHLSI